jgi:hypothetical protein
MKKRLLPSQAQLKELLDYDPDTGLLTWRERDISHFKLERDRTAWNRKFTGKEAGHRQMPENRRVVCVFRVLQFVHRLVWKWMTGVEPDGEIDHKDGNGANNRWDNLRLATSTQNKCNTRKRSNNSSGYKGVNRCSSGPKWCACAHFEGKRRYLGRHDTPEEAYAAYCKAAQQMHGEFFNAGQPTDT